MKFEVMDRDKGLELFGKLIRTKKIENMQGDQQRSGPEPVHPVDSKQKLQVRLTSLFSGIFQTKFRAKLIIGLRGCD